MGKECSMNGTKFNAYSVLLEKRKRKRPLGIG
jgi:hypothetical protein